MSITMQKRDSVFAVINGLKHIMRKVMNDGDHLTSSFNYANDTEVAEINYPKIMVICSKLSLMVEKKLIFVSINTRILTYWV